MKDKLDKSLKLLDDMLNDQLEELRALTPPEDAFNKCFRHQASNSCDFACFVESQNGTVTATVIDYDSGKKLVEMYVCSMTPINETSGKLFKKLSGKDYTSIISEDAQIQGINENNVGIVWDPAEQFVTIVIKGDYTCRIDLDKKIGYGKYILKSGSWGEPWIK